MYFRRIQGLGYFNMQKYKPILDKIFPEKNSEITKEEIKYKLRMNDYSLQLLRYLPDIFYYVSNKKPIEIEQYETQKIIEKYSRVLNYERKNNLKLPSSKQYFTYQFIRELPSKYHELLIFLPSQYRNIEKYEKCYYELFKKIPTNIF